MRNKTTTAFVLVLLAVCVGLMTFTVPQLSAPPADELEELLQSVRSGWVRMGPPGGHVPQIVFSPRDPRVVYAGLDDDQGLYKSRDGGESWTLVSGNLREISAGMT